MAKIISVGAAVQDVFLSGKIFKASKEPDGELVEEFELGAKLEVDDVVITTGGGGTNSAVTFARQGHEAHFIGVLGRDAPAGLILDDLKADGVAVDDVIQTDKFKTGYSTLLLSPDGERTVLTYRGASQHFRKADFDLEHITADWLYVTSLGEDLDVLEYLLVLAEGKQMKVALDPGSHELTSPDRLKKLLPKLTVLKANRDELGKLSGGDSAEEIARDLSRHVKYVIVTDAAAGSVASDGRQLIRAGMYEDVKVADRTGAGDAFGSGFVAALARGDSLEDSLTLGSANSTSVVQQLGAKAGILRANARLHSMSLDITKL